MVPKKVTWTAPDGLTIEGQLFQAQGAVIHAIEADFLMLVAGEAEHFDGEEFDGAQQLGAVRPEVGDRPDRDHRPGLGRLAPADASDHAIALGDRNQQLTCPLGHVRVGRVLDDRRQRAVDIEQDRRASRVSADRRERLRQ